MKRLVYLVGGIALITSLATSCVPKRKLRASEATVQSLRDDSGRLASQVSNLESTVGQLKQQIGDLNKKVEDLTNQAGMLSSDAAQKQSQLNMSKEQLAAQQRRLAELQALMDRQKKAIADIRQKMSDALTGFNAKDLTVSIKNGKVYVSLSENLLFPSGSAVVNPKGKEALGKLAMVLNNNPEITVDIEGHTDSIPIHGRYQDNWALSTARATAIVRILTENYLVDPTRVIASGHSSYDPVQTNTTPEGRALNRRTEIILTPKLDELYQLLETPDSSAAAPQ